MVTDKLKQIVFKRLYKELGNVEIIPYKDSIWLIDREKEHWYFEFETSGRLWWRYYFFNSFFTIFSLEPEDFEPILASWVEEVLNHKVSRTHHPLYTCGMRVEEVLNHKVSRTDLLQFRRKGVVEEVLNYKVSSTSMSYPRNVPLVGEVLNHKVSTTHTSRTCNTPVVEKVLNHKVTTTEGNIGAKSRLVEDVLNQK